MNRLELAKRYLNEANILYTHNVQYELMCVCCFNHLKYLLQEFLEENELCSSNIKNLTTLAKKCKLPELEDYFDYFRVLQEIKDNQEPNDDYCELTDFSEASLIMNKLYKVSKIIKSNLRIMEESVWKN